MALSAGIDPGQYPGSIKVTNKAPVSPVTVSASFTLQLNDPCTSPTLSLSTTAPSSGPTFGYQSAPYLLDSSQYFTPSIAGCAVSKYACMYKNSAGAEVECS